MSKNRLFDRLVEVGRNRGARVVEVQHFGHLVGRDDHLLVIGLDARLEIVEEDDRDDGDDKNGRRGDERFRYACRNDVSGDVLLTSCHGRADDFTAR